MKTYHYTYTIIDEDTVQYYHGKHSTNDLNDGYMGSGSWIKSIQDKENIVKLINEFYESSDAAYKAEAELIGDLWKTDELCMNRMKGGKVSFFHEETYSKHCMEVWGC